MRVGVDSYSYHRLLGEVRPGELDPGRRFAGGAADVLAECRRLGVAVASLETCFLAPPAELDPAALVTAAGGVEIVLAWGHPHGLELGSRRDRVEELRSWIELAPAVGCALVRLVAGSPRFRRDGLPDGALERLASVLADACRWADDAGVQLALENHGDVTAHEIGTLLGLVASPTLGVCLDTANALRVGDDPLEAARALAGATRMVHLKDCESSVGIDPLTGPRSVAYGDGIVPLEAILGALADVGFAGPVCVELGHLGPGKVDEVALVERSVAWLARYCGRQLGDGDPARARGDHPPKRVRNDRG